MKMFTIPLIVLGIFLATAGPAHARNEKYLLPITVAMDTTDAQEKPDGSVKFFFGKQQTPQIVTRLGSDAPYRKSTTRRTSDGKACNSAFLSALVAFQKRAQQLGANAVVNIVSYYRKNEMSSTTEFECHAGAAAHVMLKGDFVKIADQ